MTSEMILNTIGSIDDEIIEEVENLRKKKRDWIRFGSMVACFALVVMISCIALSDMDQNNTEFPKETDATQGVINLDLNADKLIYVNYRLYWPNLELTRTVTQKNIGEFAGFVSFTGKEETIFSAYSLVESSWEGNNIVVDYNGAYYAYTFYSFVPDGSNAWPVNLLRNAVSVEVRDPNYGIDNKTVYLILSRDQDITSILEFLSTLGEKHNQVELNRRYYERFKDHFADDDLWIDNEGNIGTANAEIGTAFSDLVCGTDRRIVVVMEDGTELTYSYLPGAGVILCDDFAYFLSHEQVTQINHMIGL